MYPVEYSRLKEFSEKIIQDNFLKSGTKLKQILRQVDIAARFGGDEFMVLLPDTNLEEAYRAAERVTQNLNKTKHTTWPKPLSASIGIASAQKVDYDYEALQTSADRALYKSKEKGRNTITTCLEL